MIPVSGRNALPPGTAARVPDERGGIAPCGVPGAAHGWRAALARGLTAAVVAAALAACAGGATPRPLEEVTVAGAPADGSTLRAVPELTVTGEIGTWESIIVSAQPVDEDGADDGEAVRNRIDPVAVFDLPLRGAEDGRRYRVSLIALVDGRERLIGDPFTIQLEFGIPVPVVDDGASFAARPSLQWRIPQPSAVSAEARVEYRLSDRDGAATATGASYVLPEGLVTAVDLDERANLMWRVRAVGPSGILGRWSAEAQLALDPERVAVAGRLPAGDEPSVTATPALSWAPLEGAESYMLEAWSAPPVGETARDGPGAGVERVEADLAQPPFRLATGELAVLQPATLANRIAWRVRAQNAFGDWSAWSPVTTFRYAALAPTLRTVLAGGAEVTLLLGSDGDVSATGAATEPDERPQVPVTIDRPFAIARTELTHEAAAALLTRMIRRGAARVDGERVVWNGAELPPRLLAGLGRLDFGEQWGLSVDADGAIVAREGYAAHPAIGVSWYGAIALANELSILEGRDPVYDLAVDPPRVDPSRDGYRLPTEAEWALASVVRALPEAPIAVTPAQGLAEDRAVGPLERVGINTLRSGDRWEDPLPPFTSAGGPTTPVGALGTGGALGVTDLFGNVWEWTGDWYDLGRYEALSELAEPPRNPAGPAESVPDLYGRMLRSVRGGAWNTPGDRLRPTDRGAFAPGATSHSIGVRLVRTIAGE